MMSLRRNINLQEGSFLSYPLVNFPTLHIPLNSYNVSQKTAFFTTLFSESETSTTNNLSTPAFLFLHLVIRDMS